MKNIGVGYGYQISNAIGKIPFRIITSFVSLCLLGLILCSMDASQLPDFDSYYVMYYEGGNLGDSYKGFYYIALFFQSLGLDYQQFRFFVLGFGLVFVAIIFELRRNCYPFFRSNTGLFSDKNIELSILVSIFVFEFYIIRLRAGISIIFFSLFFYLWQYQIIYRKYRILGFALLLSAFLASAVVHFDTFITIALFIGPAVLWSQYIKLRGPFNEFLYFAVCLGVWLVLFWFGITASMEGRGPDLNSKLNPIRFMMISIFPIIIGLIVIGCRFRDKNSFLGKVSFSYFYSLNYFSSAIALLSYYYFSSAAEDAGEAIVRVMTLSSFGAILSLALGGLSRRNIMALYILIVNSLFFLNTVYG